MEFGERLKRYLKIYFFVRLLRAYSGSCVGRVREVTGWSNGLVSDLLAPPLGRVHGFG